MKTSRIGKSGMVFLATAALMAAMGSTVAWAQDEIQEQTRDRTQLKDQETIYGSQLMTQSERNTHRAQLRKMNTEQEREAYRLGHHKQMQERAAAKGVTLPVEPPAGGAGSGAGLGGGASGGGIRK